MYRQEDPFSSVCTDGQVLCECLSRDTRISRTADCSSAMFMDAAARLWIDETYRADCLFHSSIASSFIFLPRRLFFSLLTLLFLHPYPALYFLSLSLFLLLVVEFQCLNSKKTQNWRHVSTIFQFNLYVLRFWYALPVVRWDNGLC